MNPIPMPLRISAGRPISCTAFGAVVMFIPWLPLGSGLREIPWPYGLILSAILGTAAGITAFVLHGVLPGKAKWGRLVAAFLGGFVVSGTGFFWDLLPMQPTEANRAKAGVMFAPLNPFDTSDAGKLSGFVHLLDPALLPPNVGEVAPDFTLLDSATGRAVTLSRFHRDRPLVLIFGSWG
jgi:hypothetical protein